MRIEGTYNFPASMDRVVEALLDADVLCAIVPGCERLIQLGPADLEGALSLEARLRLGADASLYRATSRVECQREPAHLALDVQANGPHGPVPVRGSLDLVSQNDRTVVAYAWDVDTRVLPDEIQRSLEQSAGAHFAQSTCERLASLLRAERPGDSAADALPMLHADTKRGKIILLPPDPPSALLTARTRPVLRGAIWASIGLLAGLAALALAASLIRHRSDTKPEHATE